MRASKDYRLLPEAGKWPAKLWTCIVFLSSVYSTALSGVWLAIAAYGYRFKNVNQPGQWTIEDLSTIIAAQAKTIELSFILVCVACVGQELSRRLLHQNSRGVTIAEMQLKFFLMQPGSIITNFHSFLSVITSYLGILVVFSSAIAMLYTTASDALVSPKASMGYAETKTINATVNTTFVNQAYIQSSCPVQVTSATDSAALTTCDNIQQTGFAFRNLIQYLTSFNVQDTSDPIASENRSPPIALSESLSNVQGAWLSGNGHPPVMQNVSGRVINNVTMVLPHVGVVPAAQAYASAQIPQDSNGAGELQLNASVVTPTIHVLCADMDSDRSTINRIVISEWSKAYNRSLGNFSSVVDMVNENVQPSWYNNTQFDPLWRFSRSKRPPVFPSLPGPNNTRISWSQQTNGTVYILGRDPASHLFMCEMTARLANGCSTDYHWTLSGGNLTVNCSSGNPQGYQSPSPPAAQQAGFVPAANEWSLALGIGESVDQNGSLNRLLTQLWPSSGQWNKYMPTLGEALAVLVASVLVSGSQGAPLAGDVDDNGYPSGWNGTWPLNTSFNASVSISDYAAGGTSATQRGFYVVLVGAFIINCMCLGYLLWHLFKYHGLLQDYLDPQNLFGLALNSRPSDLFASAKIEPLTKHQLKQSWTVSGAGAGAKAPAIRDLTWKDLKSKWIVMGGPLAKYIHPRAEVYEKKRRWWRTRRRASSTGDPCSVFD